MSKIKRYEPSKIVFHFSGGEESCPNPMCESEGGQYVKYDDVAALQARVKKLEGNVTTLQAVVQEVSRVNGELEDKLTEEIKRNCGLEVQLKEAKAWKERAIEWLTKNPCHFKRCEIRGRDTTPHDCRTCIEAYFAEDKP
jgi:hypothetical protein